MKLKLIDYGYKKAPERAHDNDSGADVFAVSDVVLEPRTTTKVGIGLGVKIPDGYDIVMHCKSGMSSKGIWVSNAPIDAGYTGEIHAILYNATDEPVLIKEGEKISQMVVRPVIYADFVTDLKDARGADGFGSTGK